MISNPAAVLFLLAAVVYVSLKLEEHYSVFRKLGAALVGILLAMLLSNIGVLPGDSPAYDFLVGPGVSASVVLILLSVNIRSIRNAGPVMLKAFAIGAVGTAIGSMVMASLLFGKIGPETWKLSGQFTGTYTGGGMNFAALAQALQTDNDLFTAAIAADVLVTAVWLIACLAAPLILTNRNNNEEIKTAPPVEKTSELKSKALSLEKSLYSSGQPLSLQHFAALSALMVGSLVLAGKLASWFSFLPEVLWLTTIVLGLAQIPAIKKISGGAMLGNYMLLLFLSSNGAQSVVANIIKVGHSVLFYAIGTVAIHGLVIFGIGRLLRIDAGTLSVASQANVGGPASAMALASARGYVDRVLPGIAAGLLGYAVGNYLGLGVANFMKGLLSGQL